MLLAGRRERLLGGRELEEENQALARAPPPRVATPNTLAHHRHRHPHARSALALAAAAHDRRMGGDSRVDISKRWSAFIQNGLFVEEIASSKKKVFPKGCPAGLLREVA